MNRQIMLGVLTLVWGAAVGCGEARARGDSRYRGVELAAPIAKPDFSLPTVAGDTFDFRRDTRGRVTLLFFGYTHCPDVCPVHMANIASVKRRLPWDQRQRLQVVFVTTDPDRDTADHLRSWLAQFDPEFIALRGDRDEVNAIESRMGMGASITGSPDDAGRYEVGHASQVIAFTPDDSAHVLYPFGTRQADWDHDLPLLLDERWKRPRGGSPIPPAEQHGH
jgi:protein SCO1